MNILIVDDSYMNRFLCRAILKKEFGDNVKLDEAVDGLEAVEKAKITKYDAIIMDYAMPNMLGDEATVRIKDDIYSDVFVLLVSAYSLEELRKSVKNFDYFDEYMSKPINRDSLINTIKNRVK